ncbi:MAG: hypothetical protein HYS70_03140 [Nitrospinae bacterium]|nr:hypothetical protein [Nitrospinota bacterium]
MTEKDWIQGILAKNLQRPPRPLVLALWTLVVTGGVVFVMGIQGPEALRAWEAFLINFLFWSGIAQSGIVLAAILQVTDARWGRPIKRLSEGFAAFLPISLLLFPILFLGREALFPWVRTPIPAKEAWLNVPFLFARDGLGLLVLYGLSLLFLYHSLRPDVGLARQVNQGWGNGLAGSLIRGWRGTEIERERSQHAQSTLAPILLILYGIVFSLIGFDLVMSLSPKWYSTLFGAYFFISNLYLGLAALAIGIILARRYFNLQEQITSLQFHDLGKLIFAFCMITGDFFWSQFLVIWYGNLPEEVEYVIRRIYEPPWAPLAWAVLLICYLGAFVVLLSRQVKLKPASLFAISAVIVGGMWLERYVLVVPSLWPGPNAPFGWIEILILLGFVAAYVLVFLGFVRNFPLLPISDPLLKGRPSTVE